MKGNRVCLLLLLASTCASGQRTGSFHVYEPCNNPDLTFCMGVVGSMLSFSPVDEGCLQHQNCTQVLHATREPDRSRVVWKYHVRSEPDEIGGEFDLAVTNDLIRMSFFKSQGSKRMIPEMPSSLPFMRGWVDASGDLRSEPFYKAHDNEKPQPVRKNRIFTPLPAGENLLDQDSKKYFNVFSFTSRLDDLVFRDPNTGKEVYHLNLRKPVRFTLLAYRVLFKKRGERVRTSFPAILRNMPIFQLWDEDPQLETTSQIPSKSTTRRVKLVKPVRKFFGDDQVRAFRALPVWQKFALGTMWAICVVMLVIIIITLCECGIRKKQKKRRSVSFRREETQLSQMSNITHTNGHGDQKLLPV